MTANPTAEWIARQIIEAFPWDEAPRYLIRDRDTSYGAAVTRRLRTMGIRDPPTAPRSPWQNGHVERLIGSIRRECLDHVSFNVANIRVMSSTLVTSAWSSNASAPRSRNWLAVSSAAERFLK